MLARAAGVVLRIEVERPGLQELVVEVDDEVRPAVNFPDLTGAASVGDVVVLNTWAVSLGLGTGGKDFVVQVGEGRVSAVPPGHIMKLRYTPLQMPVLAVEAPESPHHPRIREFDSLDEIPVVCAELHSQVAAVAAAIRWETGGAARTVYVMTDGGALPIALSDSVHRMKADGLLHATVTCGQAYGGDLEAVNIYSGLAAACAAAEADVIIVAQGPGAAGTGTPLGFSGADQAAALNAASALEGTPIAVLRLSFSDPRPRHYAISHHSKTVLERLVLARVVVPVPRLSQEQYPDWRSLLGDAPLCSRHEVVTVDADVCVKHLEAAGTLLSTMGRGLEEERPFFLSAAAAGLLAGQLYEAAAKERQGPAATGRRGGSEGASQ